MTTIIARRLTRHCSEQNPNMAEHTLLRPEDGMTSRLLIQICAIILAVVAFSTQPSTAQGQSPNVELTDDTAQFVKTQIPDRALLLHIRNGHERIIAFPERVEMLPDQPVLPGCDVALDGEVIAFYPTRTFQRLVLEFLGTSTGTVYQIAVRSSPTGLIHPLKLVR